MNEPVGEKCGFCGKICTLYGDTKVFIDREVAQINEEARKNPQLGTNFLTYF